MKNSNYHTELPFNYQDIENLLDFFNRILTSPQNFGEKFYGVLTNNNNELKKLFEKTHKSNLGYVFLQMIITILTSMMQNGDWYKLVKNLARRHAQFDIKEEYYPILSRAYSNTMQYYIYLYPKDSKISLSLCEEFMKEFVEIFRKEYIQAVKEKQIDAK